MATAKPAPTKTAAAAKSAAKPPKTGTALMPWEAEMKAAVTKQASAEKVVGGGFARIQIKSGRMYIDDDLIKEDEIDVVVLAAAHLNEWYDKEYDPQNPTVPACFAYSTPDMTDPEAEMRPIEADVGDIQLVDADGEAVSTCEGCWANQMGSADVGRGKACKNVRRLLVMTDDGLESAEELDKAEVRSIGIPVMSTRNWSKYLKDVLEADVGRPYFGVVTTISIAPDPKSQWKLNFAFKELINFDSELWEAMKKKTAQCQKDIVAPYPHQADLDAQKAQKASSKAPARGGKAQPMKPVGRAAQAMAKGKGSKF